MKNSVRGISSLLRACVPALLGLGILAAHANIDVNLTSFPLGGGINQYSYSIVNTGPEDVILVTLTDAPQNDALIAPTLVAPVDFDAAYDSGLGLIDSFPEIGMLGLFAAGTTVSGFEFQSAAAPPAFFTQFNALTLSGAPLTGTINFTPGTAVPDVGSTLFMASFSLLGLAAARRQLGTA